MKPRTAYIIDRYGRAQDDPVFMAMLGTIKCRYTDEIRFSIQHVEIKRDGDKLWMTGTDGRILRKMNIAGRVDIEDGLYIPVVCKTTKIVLVKGDDGIKFPDCKHITDDDRGYKWVLNDGDFSNHSDYPQEIMWACSAAGVAVNIDLLKQATAHCDTTGIQLRDELSPIRITGEYDTLIVLMPLRSYAKAFVKGRKAWVRG